jgi:hypothetical protein
MGRTVTGVINPAPTAEIMELLADPLLVAAAVAGLDVHGGVVGGASPGHVEAETGPAPNNGTVGVEGPLLVRAIVAVPDLHPGARRLIRITH